MLNRRLALAAALGLYVAVFLSFVLIEVPGLGLGHFFYIPVVLVALAFGIRGGLVAGVAASALYALAIVVTPRMPTRDVITAATAIRLVTYSAIGAVTGWYADQHRQHVERLRELAERDFVTGLLNARAFDDALARRCAADEPFTLVLADMDNLKRINDAHGHTEGNRAIRRVGEALAANAPGGTDVARVGGDEFALLVPGRLEAAGGLRPELDRVLARSGVGVSFGWAVLPDDGKTSLELFRKADDRLYAAKLVSRNRRTVISLASGAAR